MKKIFLQLCLLGLSTVIVTAEEDIKDMSDPLAIYTQAGFGFSNKGLNIKIGQSYDTGNEKTGGMNLIEIKGMVGDVFGWDNKETTSDSIDAFRFRNFMVDLKTGRGTQIDINYNLHAESGVISYSIMQALPQWGGLSIYPLAGLGVAFANNALQDDGSIDSGFSFPGVLAVVGMFAKYNVNDNIWINYNPNWTIGLAGSDLFLDHGFENNSNVLTHELALSYKITPRLNIRYFANWSENINFSDGDHRVEFNYQF